jgi:GAF domain-containing protein
VNETELPLADELAQLAARMSPLLLSTDSVGAAVDVLTTLAQETIAAATGAGVSLIDEQGQRTSVGATSEVVLEADDLQYRLDQGPCLTAWAEQRTVRVDDVEDDPRWPQWSESVRPLQVLSTLSVPMVLPNRTLGAVKVYSELRGAFDERAERLLEGFAGTAGLLLGSAASLENARQLSGNLRQALQARDAVQLAKGVIMHRDGLNEDEAFQVLVGEARVSNRGLREVADRINRAAGASVAGAGEGTS